MKLLFVIYCLISIFKNIYLYKFEFDSCSYVGTSYNYNIVDLCKKSGDNCCYANWKHKNINYYSCFNKNKLLYYANNENVKEAYLNNLHDDVRESIEDSFKFECNK